VAPEPPRQLVNPFRNAVGALRDTRQPHMFGSYEPAFLIAGALGVTVAALSLSVGRRGLLRPTPTPA
jgi:hypothetical protein